MQACVMYGDLLLIYSRLTGLSGLDLDDGRNHNGHKPVP